MQANHRIPPKVIVEDVEVAANLYQTSYATGPVHGAIAIPEAVAPAMVVGNVEHVFTPTGKVIALAHSSL